MIESVTWSGSAALLFWQVETLRRQPLLGGLVSLVTFFAFQILFLGRAFRDVSSGAEFGVPTILPALLGCLGGYFVGWLLLRRVARSAVGRP